MSSGTPDRELWPAWMATPQGKAIRLVLGLLGVTAGFFLVWVAVLAETVSDTEQWSGGVSSLVAVGLALAATSLAASLQPTKMRLGLWGLALLAVLLIRVTA